MMKRLLQYSSAFSMLGYQFAWYLCVYGASLGYPYCASLPMLIWGLVIVAMHPQKRLLLKWSLYSTLIGIFFDIGLIYAHFISFPNQAQTHVLGFLGIDALRDIQISPLWMMSLWWAWGIALRDQLIWLLKKPFLSVVLGGILGMMSHLAGGYIGAIHVGFPVSLVGLIDVYTSLGFVFGWAVYMGMMCWIYHGEQKKIWKIFDSTQP